MALTDKQQTDLYDRVMGSIPPATIKTRTNPDGSPVWLLTSADGNTLVSKIAASAADPAKIGAAVKAAIGDTTDALTPEQVDSIADAVGKRIAAGFDVELTPKPEASA